MKPSNRPARTRAGRAILPALLAVPLLAGPGPAYAYLDPGTGSILLQVLIGGAAGLGVVVKLYWHRLRGLFGARRKDVREERPPAAE